MATSSSFFFDVFLTNAQRKLKGFNHSSLCILIAFFVMQEKRNINCDFPDQISTKNDRFISTSIRENIF